MNRSSPLRVLALALACFTGCGTPLSFSGASVPTPHTFNLTADDLAEAEDESCAQTWFTGDAEADIERVDEILTMEGLKIVHWNPTGSAGTSGRQSIYVDKSYKDKSAADQALLMSHELVHACDRKRLGDATFEQRYFHSAGRWVFEVRAYAQTVRSLVAQGASAKRVAAYIDDRIVSLRQGYWLHDIDPSQYEQETRRLLELAAK